MLLDDVADLLGRAFMLLECVDDLLDHAFMLLDCVFDLLSEDLCRMIVTKDKMIGFQNRLTILMT